jgi:hypothetical protein
MHVEQNRKQREKAEKKTGYDIRHPGTQSIQVPLECKPKIKFTL